MQIALPLSVLLASLVVPFPAGANLAIGSVASAQGVVAISPIAEASAVTTPADESGSDIEASRNIEPEITDIEAMLVRGQYSGPGLWKVSKGANTLWILGTVSPVPKGMDWYSPETEAVLAQTQEFIGAPGFVSSIGAGGMLKMAFSIPTLLRARRNPDGKTLRDVLPADLYARWSRLKPVYLGSNKSIEGWRPVFAAGELYQAAIKRSGLVFGTGVDERLGQLIGEFKKGRDIKRTSTVIRSDIRNPRKLAKSFARAEMDDVQCFRSVLDRLELDVANAAQRANAWATGNMPELERLFGRGDVTPCFEALATTEAARSLGMETAAQRSSEQWLAAAESALSANQTSFATLPVGELFQPDGLLSRLQARGYVVVIPE